MLKKEVNYEFRKRMLEVHKKDIRDFSLTASAEEFEIKDAIVITVPENAQEVAFVAAQDFCDFLLKSMNVAAAVKKGEADMQRKIELFLAEDKGVDLGEYKGYRGYRIDTDENGIKIYANDCRGMAQALYYLEFMMELRRAPFIKKGSTSRKPRFAPQMVHSGYALDEFPSLHLNQIAHEGRDAILVYTEGINKTSYGFLDFNALIYNANKYGIDVYAYSDMKSKMHPKDPGGYEFYDSLYGSLFEYCPGLKGVVLVGESIHFPSKDPNAAVEKSCDGIPAIKDSSYSYPALDYVDFIETVRDCCRKHNPDADIIFWTYNFGEQPVEDRLRLINALPTDISLQATFEMFEKYVQNGIVQCVSDYSLAIEGPGYYFATEAEAAAKRGIRLYSMVNTAGQTWDFGTIPYEPMAQQWMRRYKKMIEAQENWGLSGIMESHHYGIYPSFISKLSKMCFEKSTDTMEETLSMVLSAFFGEENVEKITLALDKWSDSVRHITPTGEDQYGSFRCGPSYPFCFERLIRLPGMPYANAGSAFVVPEYCQDLYSRATIISKRVWKEIETLEKALIYMQEGTKILETIKNPNEELERLINMGKFIEKYIVTGINAKKWHTLKVKFDHEPDEGKVSAILDDMVELLTLERKNAEDAIQYVERDSRLGWEPNMDYLTSKWHLEWKIRLVDYVIGREIAGYRKNLELGNGKYTVVRD